jgi:hypothetical protein
MGETRFFRCLCIVSLFALCGAATSQVCLPDDTSDDVVITFLRTARARNASDSCIVNAIKRLQYVRSQKAIYILVQYLDFHPYAGMDEVVVTGSNSEPYPAVSSLFAIGKVALPTLIRVVGRGGSTKTAQDNAIRTIMMIHRDHPAEGVSLLIIEARGSEDAGRKASFNQAAISALRWCQGKDQKECESVLSSEGRDP